MNVANEKRLIFVEKAVKHLENEIYWNDSTKAAIRAFLRTLPAADAAEVVHARWVPLEADGYADGSPVWDLWECSNCREEHSGDEDTLTPYCPYCGAKMEV